VFIPPTYPRRWARISGRLSLSEATKRTALDSITAS
jgi:hypothetical protein